MKMTTSENIICIAKLVAKSDKTEELLQIFKKLITLSRQETGCLRYKLHQDIENPHVFTFVDRFTNHQAFDLHCQTDYITYYFDNLIPALVENMEITTHRESSFAD